jgi:hypothetical protein
MFKMKIIFLSIFLLSVGLLNAQGPIEHFQRLPFGSIKPTGGATGDEWIWQQTADATHTGYEYCSLHELMDSYTVLLQKSGKAKRERICQRFSRYDVCPKRHRTV